MGLAIEFALVNKVGNNHSRYPYWLCPPPKCAHTHVLNTGMPHTHAHAHAKCFLVRMSLLIYITEAMSPLFWGRSDVSPNPFLFLCSWTCLHLPTMSPGALLIWPFLFHYHVRTCFLCALQLPLRLLSISGTVQPLITPRLSLLTPSTCA
jgi:hypothetical protein